MRKLFKKVALSFFVCILLTALPLPLTAQAEDNRPKIKFILACGDKILSPEDTISLRPGGRTGLDARVIFSNGHYMSVSSDADISYPADWRSSDPRVIAVHNGALEGIAEGTAAVTASFRGQTASVRVRVSPAVALLPSIAGEDPAGSARMEGDKVLVLQKGGGASMTLTAVLADGTRENVTSASEWLSDNPDIVYSGWVRNWGLIIRGLAEGTAMVTASLDGLSTAIKVEVIPEKGPLPSLEPKSSLGIAEKQGNPVPVCNRFLEDAVRVSLSKPEGEITDADMAALTTLNVFAASFAGDLSVLKYATNLRKLYMSCAPDFKDLSVLAELKNLQELSINQGGGIQDLSALANLKNLQKLELYAEQVSDISPLADLTGLRELTLAGNRIGDTHALVKMNNLERLNLQGGRISDISPLAGLSKLQTLIICNTSVKDLSPLAGLTNLSYLTLSNNMVEDISPLAKLAELEYLDLWNNKISDISFLAGLDKLVYLELGGNLISDISPLVSLGRNGALIRAGLKGNNLSVGENSRAMSDINTMADNRVEVRYEPQRSYSYGVKVYVNGELIDFPDQKPFIDLYFEKTYVPVRFVSEALGCKVDWEEAGHRVIISKGAKRITLVAGGKEAEVNGMEKYLEAAAPLVNDRTIVPLRFISEALGAEVTWTPDGAGGRVDIQKNASEAMPGGENFSDSL